MGSRIPGSTGIADFPTGIADFADPGIADSTGDPGPLGSHPQDPGSIGIADPSNPLGSLVWPGLRTSTESVSDAQRLGIEPTVGTCLERF